MGGHRTIPALTVGLLASLLGTGTALAQSVRDAPLPTSSDPGESTVAARFAVAGPVEPGDTELTLILAQRSCGALFDEPRWADLRVVESDSEIIIGVDVAVLSNGIGCTSEEQIRVPVELEAPVADRTIHDAGREDGQLPLVNEIDGLDTGLPYSCGGHPARVVDLLGPGFEVEPPRPRSGLAGMRAIVDEGDTLEYAGPWRKNGSADWESWSFVDGKWSVWAHGTCTPRVVLSPGLYGATWSLRGPRPGPRARRLRINLQGRTCGGKPIGRITRPIIQVRDDSIVIIMGTFFENQLPASLRAATEDVFVFVDCQGYGPVRMTVELPVTLGNRTLYDGGVFPPRVRARGR